MRIRVAHVSSQFGEVDLGRLFRRAKQRHLAWLTGTGEYNETAEGVGEAHGYRTWVSPSGFIAVRADLVEIDALEAVLDEDFSYLFFDSTNTDLGEVAVGVGRDVDPSSVGTSLVFYGGDVDQDSGFGFYDENGRVESLRSVDVQHYLEGIFVVSSL